MSAPAPEMLLEDDSVLPPAGELTSADKRVYDRAWSKAYPVLWGWGMRVTRRTMAGAQHDHDREDVVSTAIEQFRQRLMRGETDAKRENLFQ